MTSAARGFVMRLCGCSHRVRVGVTYCSWAPYDRGSNTHTIKPDLVRTRLDNHTSVMLASLSQQAHRQTYCCLPVKIQSKPGVDRSAHDVESTTSGHTKASSSQDGKISKQTAVGIVEKHRTTRFVFIYPDLHARKAHSSAAQQHPPHQPAP